MENTNKLKQRKKTKEVLLIHEKDKHTNSLHCSVLRGCSFNPKIVLFFVIRSKFIYKQYKQDMSPENDIFINLL